MEDAIKQIGERLKGLRDVLDIPAQDVADLCGVPLETYLKAEDGEAELSISLMQKISKKYGIALDVLLFGEEPHMSMYFLTRKGQGKSVERRKAYKYQSLASGFRGRTAEPFMVLVEPNPTILRSKELAPGPGIRHGDRRQPRNNHRQEGARAE